MKKNWKEFYGKDFSLKDYLGNLSAHSTLFEYIIKEKPKNILEVGVGTGSMGIFLSHLGFDVVGVDNDLDVLRGAIELNERLKGNVDFVQADAFRLDEKFKPKFFDVVFSQGFFEHFSNFEIEKLVCEQLKVSNVVFISVPSNLYPKKDFGDERLLSATSWRNILKKIPVEIKFIIYYGPFFLGFKSLIANFLKDPTLPLLKPSQILIKIQ